MERVSIRLPKAQRKALDQLVENGAYPNRSEAIRDEISTILSDEDTPNRVPPIRASD